MTPPHPPTPPTPTAPTNQPRANAESESEKHPARTSKKNRTHRNIAAIVLALLTSLAITTHAAPPRELVPASTTEQLRASTTTSHTPILGPPRDPGRLVQMPLSDISRQAANRNHGRWAMLLVVFGLLGGAGAGISLYRRWRGDDDQAPGSVFLRYAHHLKLPWRDRLLLWRIARAAKFPTPLTLLVASGTLYHHGRQFAAGYSSQRRKKLLRQLSSIQRQAFGAEHAASTTPPPISAT